MARNVFLAVSLLIVALATGMVLRRVHPPGSTGAGPQAPQVVEAPRVVTVEVGGMVCAGCVAKIQTALADVPGVHRVDVTLAGQKASVLCDRSVADTALTAAVRRAGPEYIGFVLK